MKKLNALFVMMLLVLSAVPMALAEEDSDRDDTDNVEGTPSVIADVESSTRKRLVAANEITSTATIADAHATGIPRPPSRNDEAPTTKLDIALPPLDACAQLP